MADDDTLAAVGGYVVERPSKSHSWNVYKCGTKGGESQMVLSFVGSNFLLLQKGVCWCLSMQ